MEVINNPQSKGFTKETEDNAKRLAIIDEMSAKIAEAGLRPSANYVILSPVVAELLNSLREDIEEV